MNMATTPETVRAVRMSRNNNAVHVETDPMLKRAKDSAAMVPYWDLTDTLVDGIDEMKAQGEKYLPRFANEEVENYDNRLACAKMTNIYRDTVENLSSKPFDKEVTLVEDENKTVPESIKEFAENVDGSGNNLTVFAGATFFNGINSAIDWIWVDYDKPDPTIRSEADRKRAGLRPYWSHVLGRNVLEAVSEMIAGIETLVYMRVFEPGTPGHVRIFQRLPSGVVQWALFEKTDKEHDAPIAWLKETPTGKTKFMLLEEGTIDIQRIPFVPFITGRRDGRTYRVFPMMRDAADLQRNLYINETALEYAKQLTAYPMLSASGVKPMMNAERTRPLPILTGPNVILYAPPDGQGKAGEWKYVEPNANSLKFLAENIKETQQQARELGRQPLTANSGNITVITSAFAAGKVKSAVGAWALQLKDALENAMVLTCAFMAMKPAEYDPTVDVNVDFDQWVEGKGSETIISARKDRLISAETARAELKRRGDLSDEFNEATEVERLLAEVPSDGPDTTLDDNPPPVE